MTSAADQPKIVSAPWLNMAIRCASSIEMIASAAIPMIPASLSSACLLSVRSIPVLMQYRGRPSGPAATVVDQAIHRRSPALVTQ